MDITCWNQGSFHPPHYFTGYSNDSHLFGITLNPLLPNITEVKKKNCIAHFWPCSPLYWCSLTNSYVHLAFSVKPVVEKKKDLHWSYVGEICSCKLHLWFLAHCWDAPCHPWQTFNLLPTLLVSFFLYSSCCYYWVTKSSDLKYRTKAHEAQSCVKYNIMQYEISCILLSVLLESLHKSNVTTVIECLITLEKSTLITSNFLLHH